MAQLACDEHYWALKNVCRRGVVDRSDCESLYNGKNVFECCYHHGQEGLADELRFFSQVNVSDMLYNLFLLKSSISKNNLLNHINHAVFKKNVLSMLLIGVRFKKR